ncbi:MAG TPA: protein translocase subunit SecD [Candidatus Limnocylindrales bacterium]|jgi:preprotein translocase subunit SecD|nr:protein translocase subunit SecD [Candidatus Limnocylindrales bacterium]
MTWRRIAPWVIGLIALVTVFINLPRQTLGLDWLPREVAGVEFRTVLGLDLQGGLRVTLEVSPQEGQEITEEEVEVARDIIERRVAGIGVTEPQVRTETGGDGSQRIVVEVPGVSDQDQVRDLVGSTGQLEFIDPMGQQLQRDQDIGELIENGSVRVLFDGGEIQQGSVAPDVGSGNQIGVSFALSDEGSRIWCQFTTANVNRPGPIALDRTVITAPTIQSSICGGTTIITVGTATPENEIERTNLYNTLRFGALPVALEEQGVESVAPTLGADFLTQAIIAGGLGILLVMLFMVIHYRLPGVLAALALILYAMIIYAIFRTLGVTLTLAGVAAFILSIGMAVDANILIFERMKEELRAGKSLGPAIEAGFNRAWSSILDSNVSSLLVAGWLYWQGTTVVRGFALVLIIGVLVSMFSAITVTRTFLRIVGRTSWGRRPELYHVER